MHSHNTHPHHSHTHTPSLSPPHTYTHTLTLHTVSRPKPPLPEFTLVGLALGEHHDVSPVWGEKREDRRDSLGIVLKQDIVPSQVVLHRIQLHKYRTNNLKPVTHYNTLSNRGMSSVKLWGGPGVGPK